MGVWGQRVPQGRHTWNVLAQGLCEMEEEEELGFVQERNGISPNQVRRGEAPAVLPGSSIWDMDQAPSQLSLLPRNTEFSHL